MTLKRLFMGVLTSVIAMTLFQDRIVFGLPAFTRKCLCPQYVDSDRLRAYCGHEIIKQRASAKPSTRNCHPNAVYFCDYGPNGITYEIICEKSETCIKGSEAYKKLNNNTNLDHSNILLRYCATNEGKTSSRLFIITQHELIIIIRDAFLFLRIASIAKYQER